MIKRQSRLLLVLSVLVAGLIGCTQSVSPTSNNTVAQSTTSPTPTTAQTTPSQTAADADLTILFSKIWRVTDASSNPASNTIYVFLPNGTLLQTSCTETYGIYGWTVDKETPRVLQVSENGSPAYTAEIVELTNTSLRLNRRLLRTNESEEVTLTPVEEEFVCPDLPR
ncbi:hypothetical protein H6F67_09295 [Microcoleus sp. FACHB-1515]|uniref:hypothetical protein n=1 Tax=Cyanophyceae TaxID=3028117 RepID=UPI001686E37E|nr:hypothetical protein [Microcoleus sp. FACHB-1515]MBD2090046.1 hypothetical protein [Microcoleus sp. FACHB-1515]